MRRFMRDAFDEEKGRVGLSDSFHTANMSINAVEVKLIHRVLFRWQTAENHVAQTSKNYIIIKLYNIFIKINRHNPWIV